MRLEFSAVLPQLRRLREEALLQLRHATDPQTRAQALELKLQLDDAIGCLELCQQHGIRPNAQVLTLPALQTQTPSSEYRIIEDHESDDRTWWQELSVDDEPMRLHEGDMIVRSV